MRREELARDNTDEKLAEIEEEIREIRAFLGKESSERDYN